MKLAVFKLAWFESFGDTPSRGTPNHFAVQESSFEASLITLPSHTDMATDVVHSSRQAGTYPRGRATNRRV
jgi:hypothetical protein